MRPYLLLLLILFGGHAAGQVKQMQPFTGAMTVENGIRYDNLEIKLGGYLLLRPDIPKSEELVIRITKPWSLTADEKGNVHPGIGLKITDMKGDVFAQTANIYADNKDGFDQQSLTALSLSVVLDEKAKVNDSLIIYAKFYDEINGDSLLVVLPCRVVAKGDGKVISGWTGFSSTYGATGMFVNCKADAFRMNRSYLAKETETSVDSVILTVKSLEKFAEKDGRVFLNARYILYDKDFNIVETRPVFENGSAGLLPADLQNIERIFILPVGFHRGIARVLIQDENSTGKLDAILSFVY